MQHGFMKSVLGVVVVVVVVVVAHVLHGLGRGGQFGCRDMATLALVDQQTSTPLSVTQYSPLVSFS